MWVILVGIAGWQIYTNMLGLSALVQHYSQDITNLALTGPLYPTTGRKQVSVALIEDRSLSNLNMTWPWAYGDHARALDAILAYHPRAVVVDVLFADPRRDPTLAQLLTEIRRYAQAHVPLYFVAAPNLTPPLRTEIAASGVRLVDPTITLERGVARQYPDTGACLGSHIEGAAPGSQQCPSLAWRVYEDVYGNGAVSQLDNKSHIELVWGVRTDPINRKWMRVGDENGVMGPCPKTTGIVARLFLAVIDVSSLRSQCPYSGVIPVESLMMGNEDIDIEKLIQNRVVFYGASLEGGADKLFSPTNGLIASVFIQAMALDNLITFDGHPKRDTVTLLGVTFDSNFVQTFIVALILLALTAIHIGDVRRSASAEPAAQGARHSARAAQGGRAYWLAALRHLAWYAVILIAIIAVGICLYVFFGLSIGNWIEMVFVAGVLFELLNSAFLGRIWGYIWHVVRD